MVKSWVFMLALPVCLAAAPAPTLTEEGMRAAFQQSIQAERQKNLTAAINALKSLGPAGEKLYLVQLRLGWLMFASGRHDDSRRHYATATKIVPTSIEARLGYGQPLYAQRQYKDLEVLARQILQIDKENYTANLKLAIVLRLMKQPGAADEILRRMMRY